MSDDLNDNYPLSAYFKRVIDMTEDDRITIDVSFERDERTQLHPGRLRNYFSSVSHALARHPDEALMGASILIAVALVNKDNWTGVLPLIGIVHVGLQKLLGNFKQQAVLKLKAEFCDRAVNRELKEIHALGDLDFSPTQQKHKQRAQEKFMASIRHRREYMGYDEADNDALDTEPEGP